VGLGIYLAGTRVFPHAHSRRGAIFRVVLLVLTFFLAQIAGGLGPREYVWLLMAWAVMCAALASRPRDEPDDDGQPGPLDDARPAD
jgi:hypothetical protein